MKYDLHTPKTIYPELNYFALGFLWGIGRFMDQRFVVQYNDESIMKIIRDLVSPTQKVFPIQEHGGKTTFRLQLHTYNPHIFWMRHHGYEGRKKNEQRNIPTFDTFEQEAEFFRGFFLPHHTLDQLKVKNRIINRLRFYATELILERLNQHLYQVLNTSLKKIQAHGKNDVCHILYYQSKKEVPKIVEYLKLED